MLPIFFDFLFPIFLRDVVEHEGSPSFEARLVEHASEERVDGCCAERVEERLFSMLSVHFSIVLCLECELSNAVLSHKLVQGHNFIELNLAILCSHHAIEHFIEVDEAIVNIDSHLDDCSVNIHFFGILANIHLLQHAIRQLSEEQVDLLHFQLDGLISSRSVAPGLFEPLKVRFEPHPRIVSIDVVLRELLDDHEYEQIEHNVRDDEDEGQEEERRKICAASFAFDAV